MKLVVQLFIIGYAITNHNSKIVVLSNKADTIEPLSLELEDNLPNIDIILKDAFAKYVNLDINWIAPILYRVYTKNNAVHLCYAANIPYDTPVVGTWIEVDSPVTYTLDNDTLESLNGAIARC